MAGRGAAPGRFSSYSLSRVFSTSRSVSLTERFFSAVRFMTASCTSSSFSLSTARAWRSERPFSRMADTTSGESRKSRSLFAMEDWLLPSRFASSSWVRL